MEDRMILALCSTLLESLLFGLLLAAAAGLVIIGTKKYSAAVRYNLLVMLLSVFAVAMGCTFAFHFNASSAIRSTAGIVSFTPNHYGFKSAFSGYLNNYHNTIVLVWFMVICARSIQLAVGLHGLYELRNKNIFIPDVYWQELLQRLAVAFGIRQIVYLFESAKVKVPVVIGHLKPVILVPIGLLTALSTAEVEAILAHELAHIRRRDYLANLLQSLVEIIFFFNPAVLWISGLIKTERENCCDDLALAYSGNKAGYIGALLAGEKYKAAVPDMAMGFPGAKGKLIDRVKRIAAGNNESLNRYEKTLLTAGLMLCGVCFSAFKERAAIKQKVNAVVAVVSHELRSITKNNSTKLSPPKAITTAHSQPPATAIKQTASGDSVVYQKHYPVYRNSYTNPYKPDSAERMNAQRTYSPPYAGRGGYTRDEWKRQDSIANNAMITDLFNDHIITDRVNISFRLSSVQLIVNGQAQDDAVFRRYRDKYVPSGPAGVGWVWTHTWHQD